MLPFLAFWSLLSFAGAFALGALLYFLLPMRGLRWVLPGLAALVGLVIIILGMIFVQFRFWQVLAGGVLVAWVLWIYRCRNQPPRTPDHAEIWMMAVLQATVMLTLAMATYLEAVDAIDHFK